MMLRKRGAPPGSKKRVMTRRLSLAKVTGRRLTARDFRRRDLLTEAIGWILGDRFLNAASMGLNPLAYRGPNEVAIGVLAVRNAEYASSARSAATP